jgi:competence protein ComEA
MRGIYFKLREIWVDFCEKNGLYFTPLQLVGLLLLISFTLFSSALFYWRAKPKPLVEVTAEENAFSKREVKIESFNTTLIVVHVCGAVKHPGVYSLPAGSRVFEAVEKAGGALSQARLEGVNLARQLSDGEQVYIPRRGESLSVLPKSKQTPLIDLNRATAEELESLPGIGEELARRILEYREENGSFKSVQELLEVKGIGEGKLEEIKDKVCVK